MLRRAAKGYVEQRDRELWGRVSATFPAMDRLVRFEPIGWLHAIEMHEVMSESGPPVRGILLGSATHMFFDAGDGIERIALDRIVSFQSDEPASYLWIKIASWTRDVFEERVFTFDVVGQNGISAVQLRQMFMVAFRAHFDALPQKVDGLWP